MEYSWNQVRLYPTNMFFLLCSLYVPPPSIKGEKYSPRSGKTEGMYHAFCMKHHCSDRAFKVPRRDSAVIGKSGEGRVFRSDCYDWSGPVGVTEV